MANQNAVENSLATTTDAEQPGELSQTSPEAAAPTTPDSTTSAEDAAPQAEAPMAEASAPEAQAPASAPAQSQQSSQPARVQGELVDALVPVGEGASEQKEVEGGRPYEIVVIVRTTHGNDIEAITSRARELIESSGGAVDNVRTSDVRRFSYPINKEVEGSYVVLNTRFLTGTVKDLDRAFKLEEGILRHLIVREDQ